jgi:hypothetical protein
MPGVGRARGGPAPGSQVGLWRHERGPEGHRQQGHQHPGAAVASGAEAPQHGDHGRFVGRRQADVAAVHTQACRAASTVASAPCSSRKTSVKASTASCARSVGLQRGGGQQPDSTAQASAPGTGRPQPHPQAGIVAGAQAPHAPRRLHSPAPKSPSRRPVARCPAASRRWLAVRHHRPQVQPAEQQRAVQRRVASIVSPCPTGRGRRRCANAASGPSAGRAPRRRRPAGWAPFSHDQRSSTATAASAMARPARTASAAARCTAAPAGRPPTSGHHELPGRWMTSRGFPLTGSLPRVSRRPCAASGSACWPSAMLSGRSGWSHSGCRVACAAGWRSCRSAAACRWPIPACRRATGWRRLAAEAPVQREVEQHGGDAEGHHEAEHRGHQVRQVPAQAGVVGVDAARHAQQAGPVHDRKVPLKPMKVSQKPQRPSARTACGR